VARGDGEDLADAKRTWRKKEYPEPRRKAAAAGLLPVGEPVVLETLVERDFAADALAVRIGRRKWLGAVVEFDEKPELLPRGGPKRHLEIGLEVLIRKMERELVFGMEAREADVGADLKRNVEPIRPSSRRRPIPTA
jgi:hypothetical protein